MRFLPFNPQTTDNLRHTTRDIIASRRIHQTCAIDLVDHPLLPQHTHPQLERLVDSNVKRLGEPGASTGDVDDFNAELGDGANFDDESNIADMLDDVLQLGEEDSDNESDGDEMLRGEA